MPRIDDTSSPSPSQSHQRSFKKKNYRPWGLLDDNFDIEKQTEHKINTNWLQTEHKQSTNQTHDRLSEHNVNTNQTQTEHKPNTKLNTKNSEYKTQTVHNAGAKTTFSTLVGLQKKIILFLYDNCKKIRNKETDPLALEYLATQLNIRLGSVKTTIRRLQIKGLIKRIDFKNGRSGWSKYEVPDDLFSEIMQLETEHKININWTQTEHKVNTEVDTISFSSSCKEYLNTTTTENNKNRLQTLLSTEWQNIDIEPLSNINFTKNHLTQISTQNKLSPDIVQHSIYAFAFDLQENNKAKNIKNDPINFFMGILRNGLPYTPPSNYESPKDKALRLYNERMLKAEQGRVETEKQAVNLAFNDWFLHLTNKQKIELLPDMFRRNVTTEKLGKNKMLEGAAKSHFEAEIWPDLKNKIISGAEINTETKVIEQGEEVS